MKLHGTIEANLLAAIQSARRLRDYPVHSDTLQHWTDLLDAAADHLNDKQSYNPAPLRQLIGELGELLASRR